MNTRIIVGYAISKNYKSDFIKETMENAFKNFGVPEIVHTDRGSQYLSKMVHNYIIEQGAKHSFSDPHKPNQNQYIESFWKTMKTEIGSTKNMSEEDLRKVIDYYIYYYSNIRLHSSIGYISPIKLRNRL